MAAHSPAVEHALSEAREALARASRAHALREAQALASVPDRQELPPQASPSLDELVAVLRTLRADLLAVEAVLDRMGSPDPLPGLPSPELPEPRA